MVVVVQGCPVCGSDLNPLGCAGQYGTGRHANGGESHGNQQQSTHQCFHLLIVTIANKIGFGCFVLILQKSPFLIGDLQKISHFLVAKLCSDRFVMLNYLITFDDSIV